MNDRPRIVLVIPRGESVRNFLYSDVLQILSDSARVNLVTVVHDERFREQFGPMVDSIVPLAEPEETRLVRALRTVIAESHFRWLWSEVARNRWEVWDERRSDRPGNAFRSLNGQRRASDLKVAQLKALYTVFANRPSLKALTFVENRLAHVLRPRTSFEAFVDGERPDLVFNTSHIHGSAGFLPVRIAAARGIPTVGFVFSWDNLTSRSRILEPYDTLLLWTEGMRKQYQAQYSRPKGDDLIVTGTPQFDFHFKKQFWLSREELAKKVGFDPSRPYILWTTGVDVHFPREDRTLDAFISFLREGGIEPRPQLVVRTYVKGTSKEMKAIAERSDEDVFFPKVEWDEKWYVPAHGDQAVYTSLLRECELGINPASTVSLELMMHDKPVVNLGFDPPGSDLGRAFRWVRHLEFDHYAPVAGSGAVGVATSLSGLFEEVRKALVEPGERSAARKKFLNEMFGNTLDGKSGTRVARALLSLAGVDA